MYIYIVYMQVLNGCLAASDRQTWCLHVFTGVYCAVVCTHMDLGIYNVHMHSLHAGAQWVSRSDKSLCPAG